MEPVEILQQKVNTLMRENEEINKYLEKLEKRINVYWNTFRIIGAIVILDFLVMLWHISK